ncbi:transcriptional regulator, AraC family [Pseudoxanthomonas sp. GM95]|uniref:AraC family transcriptional regulator n=1 Tax=Pseudoxanthomonas sp. GM95 TaxID=1881043 RepID=UPI0008D1A8DE|nr:AraC family transcriptional regulator [Pseudoxanthomonas sp. GM95]SEM08078.1 transcriptional regulator, AraC family [Pseudoxanthomonas sp. GM95]
MDPRPVSSPDDATGHATAVAASLAELAQRIERSTGHSGVHATAWAPMTLARADVPAAMPTVAVQEPSLCLVAQGGKQVLLGSEVFEYDASHHLLASVDLPVTGRVTVASPQRPYLCLILRMDPVQIAALLGELQLTDTDLPPPTRGLNLGPADPALIDVAVRMMRLLDTPDDLPALAPLLMRELLYRLLRSDQGGMLRHIAVADSPGQRITRAIGWLREHYRQPLRIDTIARHAHMSPSSLHQHFKAITAMSPLQYQKQLRLQEARRLLLAGAPDAASAGHEVGYESPSQFSREYSRLFGAPPLRDIARLRAM